MSDGDLTPFLSSGVLNLVFNRLSWGVYLPRSVGLCRDGSEITGVSYSRPVTPITWQYYSGEPAGYAIANANAITFPPAGLGGWGVINGLGLWRDPTDVTMLFYSALDFSSFEVNDGDTVTIQSEGIKIRLDRIL